jgi:hypothetical protein
MCFAITVNNQELRYPNIHMFFVWFFHHRLNQYCSYEPYTIWTKHSMCLIDHFLGVFARSQKVPIIFVMSVRLSVCASVHMYQYCSHWANLCEILYGGLQRKSVEVVQIWLKLRKNFGNFTQRPKYVLLLLVTKIANKWYQDVRIAKEV